MPSEVSVRRVQPTEISELSKIHRSALPCDLLPQLGERFQETLFWPAVMRDPRCETFVAVQDRLPVGFVIFEQTPGALMQQLKKSISKRPLLFAAILLSQPGAIVKVLSNVFSKLELTINEPIHKFCELFLIAVSPEYQGQKIGQKLVMEGLLALQPWQKQCLVRTSSRRAEAFYHRHGFLTVGCEKRGASRFSVLVRNEIV